VIKLDLSGNLLWQKSLGGSAEDIATCIRQTTDGGYVLSGYSSSNDFDVSGNQGVSDYWIVRLDGAGNIIWQKSYGGTDWEVAHKIEETTDGGFIVAGQAWSNNGNVFRKPWSIRLLDR
jgi:hypothetical protein